MIPFLPFTEVDQVLEQHDRDEEQRGEILAELGMSAYHGGATAADAMSIAHWALSERDREWLASPEGERYTERLEAARFMADAIPTADMRMASASDPWWETQGRTTVPEFYPGLSRRLFGFDFRTPVDSEDIPF